MENEQGSYTSGDGANSRDQIPYKSGAELGDGAKGGGLADSSSARKDKLKPQKNHADFIKNPGFQSEIQHQNFLETEPLPSPAVKAPDSAAPLSKRNLSSELKERYRWEVDFLRKKLGPLGQIRRGLGLSQRKISELLLVDPASWHRWEKQESAPSYIYKSLQWFLALKDRNPEIASLAWLQTQSSSRDTLYIEERLRELSSDIESLKSSSPHSRTKGILAKPPAPGYALFALGVAIGFLLCYGLLRVF